MKNAEFSVLIPAYNEAKNIIYTIKETIKVLEEFNPDYELVVADDGSADDTVKKITEFSAGNKKVKLQSYYPNKGKGFALKYGTGFLNGRYILFLDADLDLHPSLINIMYGIMKETNADVVIGSKMHKDSVLNYPEARKMLSSFYYCMVKFLFRLPVKDTQTGIKLFKSEALKACISNVIVRRYAFDLELLLSLYKRGFKIVESPIQLNSKREAGRIGLKDAARMFLDTMHVFWRFYIRKYYG